MNEGVTPNSSSTGAFLIPREATSACARFPISTRKVSSQYSSSSTSPNRTLDSYWSRRAQPAPSCSACTWAWAWGSRAAWPPVLSAFQRRSATNPSDTHSHERIMETGSPTVLQAARKPWSQDEMWRELQNDLKVRLSEDPGQLGSCAVFSRQDVEGIQDLGHQLDVVVAHRLELYLLQTLVGLQTGTLTVSGAAQRSSIETRTSVSTRFPYYKYFFMSSWGLLISFYHF